LYIVSSFVGREQGVAFVEEYDRKTLYLMLVKCHGHLYPLVRLNKNSTYQNIFEQIVSTSEIIEENVKRELLIFKKYQLDVKDIKCPLQWWQKHEVVFPIVGFFSPIEFGCCWISN
jgi:hypothetical protein